MSTRCNKPNRAKFRHNPVSLKALQISFRRVYMLFSYRYAKFARLALPIGLVAGLAGGAFAQETAPASAPATEQAPAAAPDPTKIVATINGQAISEADLALALASVDQQYAKLPPDQRRAAAFMAVLEIKLLVGKAVAEGLDKDPGVRATPGVPARSRPARRSDRQGCRRHHHRRRRAGALRQADLRDAAGQRGQGASHSGEDRGRGRAIIKQLDDGADFEKLANDNTLDPSGKTSGGDLGYFTAGQMVPEFSTAALALDIGKYTEEPVKTDFGWHVIKLEDKRIQQPPAFEQVKAQIKELVLREKYFALVNELRAAATVDIADAGAEDGHRRHRRCPAAVGVSTANKRYRTISAKPGATARLLPADAAPA